jgi:hypothetical protein
MGCGNAKNAAPVSYCDGKKDYEDEESLGRVPEVDLNPITQFKVTEDVQKYNDQVKLEKNFSSPYAQDRFDHQLHVENLDDVINTYSETKTLLQTAADKERLDYVLDL